MSHFYSAIKSIILVAAFLFVLIRLVDFMGNYPLLFIGIVGVGVGVYFLIKNKKRSNEAKNNRKGSL